MKARINNSAFNYWQNMMDGNFYIKGEYDSLTTEMVLATKTKTFGPDDCYFSYVSELPKGTCYVDNKCSYMPH